MNADKPTSLAAVTETPSRFDWRDREQLDLLKAQINPDLTDDEFALFVQVAKHTGLDPFRRQIYGIKRGSKLTIQTGIDGYRAIAARTGLHAGTDDAEYFGLSKDKQFPGEARVTVYKIIGGLRVPFTATARWDEYKPQQDAMWKRMPHNMLGKCAEALALRKAFPEETAGIDAEEATVDTSARTVAAVPRELSREELLAARFNGLDVGDKVAFTAWCKEQKIPGPGQRNDEQLDLMEWKLDWLDGTLDRCADCDEPAVDGTGYCAEHGAELENDGKTFTVDAPETDA